VENSPIAVGACVVGKKGRVCNNLCDGDDGAIAVSGGSGGGNHRGGSACRRTSVISGADKYDG
jgi:hypothetical protein